MLTRPGHVYAMARHVDDPTVDRDIAVSATAALQRSGLDVQYQEPPFRGGRGAGPGAPIDALVFVVLPLAGAAVGQMLGGMLGAAGSDLWQAIKKSVHSFKAEPRPLSRTVLEVRFEDESGAKMVVRFHPDDPDDAVDLLLRDGFAKLTDPFKALTLWWSQDDHLWKATVTFIGPHDDADALTQ